MALGVTLSTPDADRVSYSREELDAKIKVALGGRVAEEVVYGKITTGAESDIQQLTQIARQMVGRWGMSDKLGPITAAAQRGPEPVPPRRQRDLAADPMAGRPGGPPHRREAHDDVTQLLTDHRDQLDSLAHALLDGRDARRPRRLRRGRARCIRGRASIERRPRDPPSLMPDQRALRQVITHINSGRVPATLQDGLVAPDRPRGLTGRRQQCRKWSRVRAR